VRPRDAAATMARSPLLPRVVENEWDGIIVCPTGDGFADQHFAQRLVGGSQAAQTLSEVLSNQLRAGRRAGQCQRRTIRKPYLASARPAKAVSRARGGCISRGRSFCFHFYHGDRKRATGGHGASPRHTIGNRPNVSLDWRSRCIGIVVRGCWNCFTPPHCAGNCSVMAFLCGAKPVFRRCTRGANLCRLASGPASWWTKPLSWKSRQSRHCCRYMTCSCRPYLRMSSFPAGLLFNFHALRLKDDPRRFVG
jgi:hypothetical protein